MTYAETVFKPDVESKATWIELDASALRQNALYIKRFLSPHTSLLAVVKANAYGHGIREVAQVLSKEVSFFGVATIDEAILLRKNEITTPILVFGSLTPEEIELAISAKISLAVSSFETAKQISTCAEHLKKRALIHIKIDTGMGRLGIPAREALKIIPKIYILKGIDLEGVFTHFAQGEIPDDLFTQYQIETFKTLLGNLTQLGIEFPFCHATNSAGTFNYKEAHFNLVRSGLLLYGIDPSGEWMGDSAREIQPILSWRARISLIKQIESGESVGYGRTFVAEKNTFIAVIPVGYSHGYPFSLSNKGMVLVRGKLCPVIGRVSMDFVTVDLGPMTRNINVNESVTILGEEAGERITCEMLAEKAGTIPYEIVTRLNPQISRVVVNE